MGLIRFKTRKKSNYYNSMAGKLYTIDYRPESFIMFNEERIGHIIDGEIYFYITVEHKDGEPEETKCLNYVPTFWRKYPNHIQAKQAVEENSELIWNTLNIYHPLKHQK